MKRPETSAKVAILRLTGTPRPPRRGIYPRLGGSLPRAPQSHRLLQRSRPVSLRPLVGRRRWIYFLCVGLSVMLVMIGWILNVKSVLKQNFANIGTDFEASFQRASESIEEINDFTVKTKQDVSGAIEQATEAYKEEKIRQEKEGEIIQ